MDREEGGIGVLDCVGSAKESGLRDSVDYELDGEFMVLLIGWAGW